MDKQNTNPNREYRDSVFVNLLTSDIKNLLSLCKALDKTITTDEIELIKLENTLYQGIKNDVSCKIGNRLIFLVEHQSTINENMPLRFLEYIARIYLEILDVRERYAKFLVEIPTPEFYVLYNGDEYYPSEQELRLSNAFSQKGSKPQLELIVKVININFEENTELLKNCDILKEYAEFIYQVKINKIKYGKAGYDKAIRYCIKNNILKDYITSHAKEIWVGFLAKLKTDTLRILQCKILNKELELKVCYLQNMTTTWIFKCKEKNVIMLV
ncbi:MAG: Rpn family recombination-promoting nuclease/putative transposase [Treponema sp.]